MIDPRSIAACPACRDELEWHTAEVRCTGCNRTYGIIDGIAVLLPDDRQPGPEEPSLGAGLPPMLRKLVDLAPWLSPSATYKSPHTRSLVQRFVDSFHAEATVLNVGAGNTHYGSNVIGVDIGPFGGVDLVGVAEALPVRDRSCDGVILQAVLEHVEHADLTLREIRRVLRPGGRLLVEVPFMQGYHPSPLDCRRFTEAGLRAEVEDLELVVEASGAVPGPASAAAWIGGEYLALALSGRSERAYRRLRPLMRAAASPIKYADRWLDTHPLASTASSGVWVRAHKAADTVAAR
jgi:uncharacterized protein YbaR (Trm112 family)